MSMVLQEGRFAEYFFRVLVIIWEQDTVRLRHAACIYCTVYIHTLSLSIYICIIHSYTV